MSHAELVKAVAAETVYVCDTIDGIGFGSYIARKFGYPVYITLPLGGATKYLLRGTVPDGQAEDGDHNKIIWDLALMAINTGKKLYFTATKFEGDRAYVRNAWLG